MILHDPRFATECDDLQELLATVDLDSADDIETFLMFLFDRPVRVSHLESEGPDDAAALDVTLWGGGFALNAAREFPLSIEELVFSCSIDAVDLGPHPRDDGTPGSVLDAEAMTPSDLEEAVAGALGQVRLYNMLHRSDAD